MWEYEHSVETGAAREAIWRLWADVERWGAWDSGIEKIEINGEFAVGTEITMFMPDQDPVRVRIAEVRLNELFVDEARIEGLTLRSSHRLDRIDDDRTRVVHRMEITGPGADQVGPRIGPAITADWPETMAALVELAARG